MPYTSLKCRISSSVVTVILLCISVNATIISIVPDSAGQGEQLTVSITGQGTQFCIQQGSQTVNNVTSVYFKQGSATINASNFSVADATHLGANFTIATDASLELYDVTVQQNSGGTHTLTECFTITLPDTTDKVIGHWTFDEGSGSQLLDHSGNGNNGTIEGPVWVDGISGTALRFDGIDDYVVVQHYGSLTGMQNLTAELWVRLTNIASGDNNNFINIWGDGGWEDDAYGMGINFDGPSWNASISGSSSSVDDKDNASDSALTEIGSWYHVAMVYSGDSLKLYTNGVLSFSDKSMEQPIKSITRELLMGGLSFDPNAYFDGDIDEVRLLTTALSAFQIQERYNSFLGPKPELIAVPSPTYNRRPVLKWYKNVGDSSYNIQVDTTTDFQSPIISVGVSDTTFTPLADLPIGTIYWRVGAGQPMIYSTTGSFVIQDSLTPMLIPYEPNPTLQRRPTLKWYKVTGASTYHLMVDNDISFVSPEISLSVGDTSFTPLSDLPIDWIYWKVKSDLNEQYSAVSSFIIQSDSIPFLYGFKGMAVNEKRPVFRWKPVTGATAYKIEIDTTSGFTAPVVTIELSDTTFTPLADLEYRLYYWHVSCSRNMALFSPTDSVRLTDQVEIENQTILPTLQMLRVFPNPFKGEVNINFGKPLNNGDFLSIYSIDGKLVKQFSFEGNAGKTTITWDGRNRNGRIVGNGIYVVKLKSGDKILNKKLISIK